MKTVGSLKGIGGGSTPALAGQDSELGFRAVSGENLFVRGSSLSSQAKLLAIRHTADLSCLERVLRSSGDPAFRHKVRRVMARRDCSKRTCTVCKSASDSTLMPDSPEAHHEALRRGHIFAITLSELDVFRGVLERGQVIDICAREYDGVEVLRRTGCVLHCQACICEVLFLLCFT